MNLIRLKNSSLKHRGVQAFANSDGLVLTAILSIGGAILLSIAKRKGSESLTTLSVVLFVLAGVVFVSSFWMSMWRRRSLRRTSKLRGSIKSDSKK